MTYSSLKQGIDPDQRQAHVRQARRSLRLFLIVLVPLSIVLETLLITGRQSFLVMALFAWTPAIASIMARLVLHEGFADVSFWSGGRRGLRAILIALIFPVGVGAIAYGIAWTTGLAEFVMPTQSVAWTTLATVILFAAGEEIGWRGYLLTRLMDAGVSHPILLSGLVWSFWHVALILGGGYAAGLSPILSVVIFVFGVTSVGYVFAYLRLWTGSVWSAIVLHSAWNIIIQFGFDPATVGDTAKLWVGESGILVNLVLFVAALMSRGRLQQIQRLGYKAYSGNSENDVQLTH
ncbi:MAG: CPBP family intramembrane metalloprotease [Leptolyngbyaceae cyanobacterium CSU_1_3]|nr:CPBP family intramembrane metalloprotease [Leptolyngbyaceae cyanobacterium CSU_1_3]